MASRDGRDSDQGWLWRRAGVGAGIAVTIAVTALIWFWVIDSQARAIQEGEIAPLASPIARDAGADDE